MRWPCHENHHSQMVKIMAVHANCTFYTNVPVFQVMDVTVHCLDSATLKARGLQELFPAVYK